jgi:hypothetical protein
MVNVKKVINEAISFLKGHVLAQLIHQSMRTIKMITARSVLLMKNSVNHAHIDKYFFSKLMDSLMNMKYKSIPLKNFFYHIRLYAK